MAHLVYHAGSWDRVEPAWQDSCSVVEENVVPQAGDTFSDFTSHYNAKNCLPQGLKAVILRTAMWGEKDYKIVVDE